MTNLIEIANNGPLIKKTNFWDTSYASQGLYYLTWNAGAARLLVPDNQAHSIMQEIQNVSYVILTQGKLAEYDNIDAIEILFEDNTNSPFVITLSAEQSDRIITKPIENKECLFSVWTRNKLVKTFTAWLQTSEYLPCLQKNPS